MRYSNEFVPAPWGKICVVRGGNSGKTLLALHGVMDNAGGLQSTINLLFPQYNVYIAELPGCGFSDPYPPGPPLYVHTFVEIIRRVVEHYDLKDFYFVGHSLGAQIGLLYHMIYPDNIKKFVSMDSLAYPPIEAKYYPFWYKMNIEAYFEDTTYAKRNSSLENGPMYTYEEALASITKARGITVEAARPILNRNLKAVENSQKFRLTWDQRLKNVVSPTHTIQQQLELLDRISIPYLLILTDESVNQRIKYMNPYIMQPFMKNPLFRLEIIKGNHDVHLNKTGDIAKMIIPFLNADDVSKLSIEKTLENVKILEDTSEKQGNVYLNSKMKIWHPTSPNIKSHL